MLFAEKIFFLYFFYFLFSFSYFFGSTDLLEGECCSWTRRRNQFHSTIKDREKLIYWCLAFSEKLKIETTPSITNSQTLEIKET